MIYHNLDTIRMRDGIGFLKLSLCYLLPKERETVEDIITKYSELLAEQNKITRTVIDPTNKELGMTNSSLKKHVAGEYLNPLKSKYEYKEIEYCDGGCGGVFNDDDGWSHTKECNDIEEQAYQFNDNVRDKYQELSNIVMDACNKTTLTQDIIDAKILLSRRTNWHQMGDLEKSLSETIKIEFLRQFNEQNKDLQNKLNLKIKEHESSK